MQNRPQTIMSIAVHHNRIGFCFMVGRQPMDWKLSYKAARTFDSARGKIAKWIEAYSPDLVITEQVKPSSRKGERTQALLEVIQLAVKRSGTKSVQIPRQQPHTNKYVQIEELVKRYPQMQAVAPKRRLYYEKEPPYVTLFESLAMAEQHLNNRVPHNLPT